MSVPYYRYVPNYGWTDLPKPTPGRLFYKDMAQPNVTKIVDLECASREVWRHTVYWWARECLPPGQYQLNLGYGWESLTQGTFNKP